jgi:hypothetical protein
MAIKSRRDPLAYAMSAMMAVTLGAPTALAANAVHIPGKYMVRSAARVRQMDCNSVPPSVHPGKELHDPFASMWLG